MMSGMANCGGWMMMVGMGVIYIILLLVGAAAVKYLFFAKSGSTGVR
jgi:hypothetical protein